jgi:glycosyltransferase involved in cell wall biosynthesis
MINYLAPINDLSYGVVGANLLIAMQKRTDVTLFPINAATHNQTWVAAAKKAVANQDQFDGTAPSLRLWHQFALHEHVGSGPKYGYSIFETNRFTEREKNSMKWLDGMFVCSGWFKEVVEQEVPELRGKVHVAPLGVDRQLFPAAPSPHDNWTTFMNIGKWEYRKGHDVLIQAFNKAFEPRDRVRLLMACHNPFLTPERNNGGDGNAEWENMYKGTKMGGNVTFLPRYETQAQLLSVMHEADCGVFPSRSEGWNLPLLEMLSCGKAAIATNYAAHTEFCNDDAVHLIDVPEEEEAYDGVWFKGDVGTWADVNCDEVIDGFVESMRAIHLQKQDGAFGINEAGREIASAFSWDRTASSILETVL